MQLGPIRRQPARRIRSTNSASRALPVVSALAEPGADDANGAHALGDALVDHRQHGGGGHDDDREIHGAGDIGEARAGADAVDLGGRWMDGPQRAGVAGGHQVVEDLRADLAALAVGADHRDGLRLEKAPHRRGRGGLRSRGGLARERLGHRQRQRDATHASLDRTSGRRTRIRERRRASAGCRRRRRHRTCRCLARAQSTPAARAGGCRCRVPEAHPTRRRRLRRGAVAAGPCRSRRTRRSVPAPRRRAPYPFVRPPAPTRGRARA